jgi:hypothetical protein
MNQTLHIVRKDLRRLRWLLVAWVAIIIGRIVLTTAGSTVEPEDIGLQLIVQNLTSLLGIVDMLMWVLLVSLLVHEEPLVGADAFWLTRPIRPNALMTAKLALAGVFLVFAPLTRGVIEMAWFGASPRDVVVALPSLLFTQAFWVALLLTLAVLTPSLTRFVVTIAASIAALGVAIAGLMTFLVLNQEEERAYYEGPVVPDSTGEIVGSFLLLCVAFGVIAYQYRHRWPSRAILIGAAGSVATVVVAFAWPWHFARAIEPDPGAWAHDSTRTIAVLDAHTNVSEAYSLRRGKNPKKQVAARLDLVGAPAEYDVESVGVRARLAFPDGTTIESTQRENAPVTRPPGDRASTRTTRLQAVLGDVRLAPETGDTHEMLPVVIKVADPDYERYGAQAGHLTATVDFQVHRFRMSGTLPLSRGAILRDGTDRFEIVRVLRRSDGCDVLLRQLTLLPMWSSKSRRQFYYVLLNRGRREAINGDIEGMMPLGQWNLAGALFGIHVEGGTQGFSVWTQTLRFPPRAMAGSPTRQIDSAWLDGAEVVVIESAYAGHVTRSLEVDGFKMRQ